MRHGETIGRYRIERALGAGGMGMVYAARDIALDRQVALKLIHEGIATAELRERFRREARAAAAVNHPNLCHVYEIGEAGGEMFIAMEMLEGTNLGERIADEGALPLEEVVRIGLALLDTLAVIHRRGLIHRDLKPSNVFLTHDGQVKLLDFGLAMPITEGAPAEPSLTQPGLAIGSPGYMAPEQVNCTAVDARTDLFALATLLHEAITGERAFAGASPVETMFAVLHDEPQRIGGSARHEAVGGVLARSLGKRPEDRHPSAEAMAVELRNAAAASSGGGTRSATVVRLAVMPFRMLRPDPDKEFLCEGLADGIAMALAGIHSLVVRSTAASGRFAAPVPDLARIAAALDVDVVLLGTLLPVGERCRLAAQLVEAPGGRVIWSQTSDVTSSDIFELQDTLTRRIVESLRIPLTARERGALGRDVPASAEAYEFFLRANRSAFVGGNLSISRSLYRRALELDPSYAPAWARLGRVHRIMGKYQAEGRAEHYRQAEEEFEKALALHPDLPAAHHGLAQLDLDLGRIEDAVERLLGVVDRNPNDPEGYAGLVTAFRYVGMHESSIAASRRARELDPEIRTSVLHSYDTLDDLESAQREEKAEYGEHAWVQYRLGRKDEARALLARIEPGGTGDIAVAWGRMVRAAFEGDPDTARASIGAFENFPDPEGMFVVARVCVLIGDHEEALRWYARAVDGGYGDPRGLLGFPTTDALRADPRFTAIVARAQARHDAAVKRWGGRL